MIRRRFAVIVAAVSTVLVGGLLVQAGTSGAAPVTKIGMSTPRSDWDLRLSQTGPVHARRLFDQLASPADTVTLARDEVEAGRYPILSFKLPNDDWAGAAAGQYDTQLRNLAAQLDAIPGDLFITVHHEPNNDGTAANFAAMQRRVLPILRAPDNVEAGVIMNGFIFRDWTDAQIAQWLPADVIELSEIVAADFYQFGTEQNPDPDNTAGMKIRDFSAWATRVGADRLGVGEYNGWTAEAVGDAGDAVLEDPRYVFAAVFNSDNGELGFVLSGERLEEFKETVRESEALGEPTTTTSQPPTTTTTEPPTTTTTEAPTTTTTEPPTTTTTEPPTTTTTVPPGPTDEELVTEAMSRLDSARAELDAAQAALEQLGG